MEPRDDALTPREELDRRHAALAPRLEELDVNLTIVATNPHLYYLAGSVMEGMLVMSRELPSPVYMARRVYDRARHHSALDEVRRAVSPGRLCDELGIRPVKRVGLELDAIPHAFVERIRRGLGGPDVELVDVSSAIRETRARKSAWEVERIEEAARQADAAFQRATEVLEEGMTELELSVEVERTMRLHGHEGLVRMHRWNSEINVGIVLAGPSATTPTLNQAVFGGPGLSPAFPFGASTRRIRRSETVVIDICGLSRGYLSDETRVLSIGPLPDDVQTAQEATQEILARVSSRLRPGEGLEDLWLYAESLAGEMGYAEGFMGVGETKVPFIGHGIGIELDELPVLAAGIRGELCEGAVVALEPKIVMPGVGVPGEENTYLVTDDGPRQLTHAPVGPIVV